MHRIALLGTGLIGTFYTMAIQGKRSRDRIHLVYSRQEDRAEAFAKQHGIPVSTSNLESAVNHPEVDVVIIGLPNHLHLDAAVAAAEAGKAVLCTKPLGRNAAEAQAMLHAVASAGVFHGYLEDLVYTPKTLKALQAIREGAVGRVTWVRSRETHSGPHSAWFWDREQAGGGAMIDLGCHCVAIARNFIGKDVRPLEVVCWADTQVHPIDVEDHAIGMVRYENGSIGQFEVSWTFRGGMDLRDEISGTQGTIWLNHWLRTGMEIYSAERQAAYVTEKSESDRGWLFPVADEPEALGYVEMFADMFGALENNTQPAETFYDGYVVNALLDAAYRSVSSKQWEPIELIDWHAPSAPAPAVIARDHDAEHTLIKQERMPDGSTKFILRHKQTGQIIERY